MPRAKKYRIRRTLTLTKEANQLLNERAKANGAELSQVVSAAIVEYCRIGSEIDRTLLTAFAACRHPKRKPGGVCDDCGEMERPMV